MLRLILLLLASLVFTNCAINQKGSLSSVGSLPPNITLSLEQSYYLISVFDEDYLPYVNAATSAAIGTLDADGKKDMVLDLEGVLPADGVSFFIPYKVTKQHVQLPAFSQRAVIPAVLTWDNREAALILSYEKEDLKPGSGVIKVTIKPEKGTVRIKKLDLNKGLGSNFEGVVLAAFTLPKNDSGKKASIWLRVIPGIPDRNFNDPEHRFLYTPVVSLSGKVWLSNNLGANYNKLGHPDFNPTRQGTSATDHNAYGSLYQWGRYSDGHELINWANGTEGTPINGLTNSVAQGNTPGHSDFITYNPDWRVPSSDELWQGVSGVNNPCPMGFEVPTFADLKEEFTAYDITNNSMAYTSVHKFVLAGSRNIGDANLKDKGLSGYYWTSTAVVPSFSSKCITYSSAIIMEKAYAVGRSYGASVRCIKGQ